MRWHRSEGFRPNGIFGSWAWWSRGLTKWESCWDVAAPVTWKLRSTFRPGSYILSCSYGFGVLVRDIWEWRPGFYTEFQYESREQSGLAWAAIFWKSHQICGNANCSQMGMLNKSWMLVFQNQTLLRELHNTGKLFRTYFHKMHSRSW